MYQCCSPFTLSVQCYLQQDRSSLFWLASCFNSADLSPRNGCKVQIYTKLQAKATMGVLQWSSKLYWLKLGESVRMIIDWGLGDECTCWECCGGPALKIHKYIKYVMFNLNFLSSVMFYTLFSINRTPLCFVGGGDGLIGAQRERER